MPEIVERSYSQRVAAKKPIESMTLQERLIAELPKKTGQMIRTTEISPGFFRANWYALATVDTGTTVVRSWKIFDSRFLRVTDNNGTLTISDQTIRK